MCGNVRGSCWLQKVAPAYATGATKGLLGAELARAETAGCGCLVDTDLDTKRFGTARTGWTGRTGWTDNSLVSGTEGVRCQRPGRFRST